MGRDILFFKKNKNNIYKKTTSVSLGSGDAWPCYFRPFFVAAYIKEKREGNNKNILDAIELCCPPEHKITMLDEEKLYNYNLQNIVDKVNLYPFVELIYLRKLNIENISSPIIKRVSNSMQILKNYLPYEDADLIDTPYFEADDYNLADERYDELINAFKKTSLHDDTYAIVA